MNVKVTLPCFPDYYVSLFSDTKKMEEHAPVAKTYQIDSYSIVVFGK